ncbi:hypothetical protein HAX54_045003 [Datura stramonium]|uniref:Uncharacterized protein n=1 Tax=Datura stramonium TaxID=4076 RepID=A0ABS8WFB4_DATST|nr:hypothetical protein [Datura stramonium]
MISGLIEAQRHGTEEIERLTMLLAQKEVEMALLKADRSGREPGNSLYGYFEAFCKTVIVVVYLCTLGITF